MHVVKKVTVALTVLSFLALAALPVQATPRSSWLARPGTSMGWLAWGWEELATLLGLWAPGFAPAGPGAGIATKEGPAINPDGHQVTSCEPGSAWAQGSGTAEKAGPTINPDGHQVTSCGPGNVGWASGAGTAAKAGPTMDPDGASGVRCSTCTGWNAGWAIGSDG